MWRKLYSLFHSFYVSSGNMILLESCWGDVNPLDAYRNLRFLYEFLDFYLEISSYSIYVSSNNLILLESCFGGVRPLVANMNLRFLYEYLDFYLVFWIPKNRTFSGGKGPSVLSVLARGWTFVFESRPIPNRYFYFLAFWPPYKKGSCFRRLVF